MLVEVLVVLGSSLCFAVVARILFVANATSTTNTTNATPNATPNAKPGAPMATGPWRNAMLTCFKESSNFASEATDPSKTNVVAVHERDWNEFKNKRLLLKLPTGVHAVEVRDYCDAKVASCNTNMRANNNTFLIDINNHALGRVWPGKSCDTVYQTVQFKTS